MAKNLSVLLLGQPGIGKSTLVNGLFGQKVAKVSEKGKIARHGVTRELQRYDAEVGDSIITVWDTPGLLDPEIGSEKTLQEIKRISQTIDLFLFCINMNSNRVYDGGDEDNMIKLMTEILGEEIWNRTLIILVQANLFILKLKAQEADDNQVVKRYKENIKQWKSILREKIPVRGIKVIPVGFYKSPNLFPKDKRPWLSKFWIKVFTLLPDKDKELLLKINVDRLYICSESGLLQTVRDGCRTQENNECIVSCEEKDSKTNVVHHSPSHPSAHTIIYEDQELPSEKESVYEIPTPLAYSTIASPVAVDTPKCNTTRNALPQPVPRPRKKRAQSLPVSVKVENGDISEPESILPLKLDNQSRYSDIDSVQNDSTTNMVKEMQSIPEVSAADHSCDNVNFIHVHKQEVSTTNNTFSDNYMPVSSPSTEIEGVPSKVYGRITEDSSSTSESKPDETSVASIQLDTLTLSIATKSSGGAIQSTKLPDAQIGKGELAPTQQLRSSEPEIKSEHCKTSELRVTLSKSMALKEQVSAVEKDHTKFTQQSSAEVSNNNNDNTTEDIASDVSIDQQVRPTRSAPGKLSMDRFNFLTSSTGSESSRCDTTPAKKRGKLSSTILSQYESFGGKSSTLPHSRKTSTKPSDESWEIPRQSAKGKTLPKSFSFMSNETVKESQSTSEKYLTLPARTREERRPVISPSVKKLQDDLTTQARELPASDKVLQRIKVASHNATYLNEEFIQEMRKKDIEEQPIIVHEGLFGKIKKIVNKLLGF